MSDKTNIKQTVEKGDNAVQIGTQNNVFNNINVGMSVTDACNLTIKLFYENFPKLEEKAVETVNKRINEFKSSLLQEFANRQMVDFSALSDPDVQYVLVEAQTTYARFGEKDMLEYLSKLIADRIEYNYEDISLKVATDRAIGIVGMLTQAHLDYLSLMFMTKKVKSGLVTDLKTFQDYLDLISKSFSKADIKSFAYLNMLGCFSIHLGFPKDILEHTYPFVKGQDITYPKIFDHVHGDYTTSQVGTILAIKNAEIKLGDRFNYRNWIYS